MTNKNEIHDIKSNIFLKQTLVIIQLTVKVKLFLCFN